jgi:hypothetical protein
MEEVTFTNGCIECLADEELLAEDWLSLEDMKAWKDL